jgi:hypothetical protein
MAGSVYTHTRDALLAERAGSVFTHTRDVELLERSGSVFTHTRGAPYVEGLIRGPQFRRATIGDDRFVNRLTSVLVTTTAIDLTSSGTTTTLYTVPAGKIAFINGIIFRAVQESAVTDASVSVGINPSADNLFDEQQLVNFRVVHDVWSLWSDKSTTLIAQAGEQIDVNIVTPATGSLLADAYLIGFLL